MSIKYIKNNAFSFLILSSLFLFTFNIVRAESLVQACSGNRCQLSDLMNVVVRATQIILGLTGTVALVAFVYGGFMFLISAGSSEKVNQAKGIIKGAIIGIIVVFLSFSIISLIFKALGVADSTWWTMS